MKLVAKRAEAEGLATAYDAAANLVMTLPGQQERCPFVACGSHLDSVPVGGNYDGAAGVVAGLMSLLHLKHRGIIPSRSIKVICKGGAGQSHHGFRKWHWCRRHASQRHRELPDDRLQQRSTHLVRGTQLRSRANRKLPNTLAWE